MIYFPVAVSGPPSNPLLLPVNSGFSGGTSQPLATRKISSFFRAFVGFRNVKRNILLAPFFVWVFKIRSSKANFIDRLVHGLIESYLHGVNQFLIGLIGSAMSFYDVFNDLVNSCLVELIFVGCKNIRNCLLLALFNA